MSCWFILVSRATYDTSWGAPLACLHLAWYLPSSSRKRFVHVIPPTLTVSCCTMEVWLIRILLPSSLSYSISSSCAPLHLFLIAALASPLSSKNWCGPVGFFSLLYVVSPVLQHQHLPWCYNFRRLEYVGHCIPLVRRSVLLPYYFVGNGGFKQCLLLDNGP